MAETDRRCGGRPLSLENRVDCMKLLPLDPNS